MVPTVLWESQPAPPHLVDNAALFGFTQIVWLRPCCRGQVGSNELACRTVVLVVFLSMSVRRGDISLSCLILRRICTWPLSSWGEERSSYHVPSAEAAG